MLRKISALFAASALVLFPVIADAAPPAAFSAPTTTAQIQSAVFPNLSPVMKIACMGDSIMNYTCLLDNNSWLFWALASKPRRINLEPNANGEYNGSSGTYPAWGTIGSDFAVAGSSTGTGSCGSNGVSVSGGMNCPNKIAAVEQYNPDILVVWVGANEGATGSAATMANVNAVVQALQSMPGSNLKSVILVPTAPRTSNSQGTPGAFSALSMQNVIANRQAAIQLERTNPVYHILDIPQLMVDPTTYGYAPTGGCASTASGVAGAGTAGAATDDCIHPSVFTGFTVGYGATSVVNRLFDSLGIDAIQPRMLAPGDYWDATNAPYGQLLSSETGTGASVTASANYGIMASSGGTDTVTGASGVVPLGWRAGNGGSSNAELTYTGSVNVPITDQYGQKRLAYQTVFSSASTLTLDRTWTKPIYVPTANFVAGGIYEASVHAKIKSGCSGLTAIGLSLSISDTAAGQGLLGESSGTGSVPYLHNWAQDLIPSAADVDLDIAIPTFTVPTGATLTGSATYTLTATFSQASNAPVACTIQWADAQWRRIR